MPVLEMQNVCFSYDKKNPILKNVSLSIESGEFVAIIGHNGSGKSTTAKLFNALLLPDSGKIIVDGMDTSDKNHTFDIRKNVGVVFQNPDNQLIASIVEDDIAFGPENIGVPREEIGERIDFALKSVGMEQFRKSSPTRLSGGQKQRIAVAGMLALKPKILVLDESTAMLDPKGRKELLSVVHKLNKEQGMTVILITHYMEEVLSADKVFVLSDGELVMSGAPGTVFKDKKTIKNYGLELPLASYIAGKMREQGLSVPENILLDTELLEAICKL